MNKKPNLVIGAVYGYGSAEIEPFAHSLRASGYTGEIVFFTHSVSDETSSYLRSQFQCECIPIQYRGAGAFNSWMRFWPGFRLLHIMPLLDAIDRPVLTTITDFAIRRYLCALQLLEQRKGHYENVFLTDVRDVWFQGDPFGQMSRGLHVFLEAPWMNYDLCEMNREWLRVMYGEALLQQFRERRVSCCGTILADADSMFEYLSSFLKFLAKCKRLVHGADTAVHNRIIYEEVVAPTTIWENGKGAVLTINNRMDPKEILAIDGTLRNPTGKLIPVIHQYDRMPIIADALLGKLGAENTRKPGEDRVLQS
jgi:hypothetical protein